MAGKPKHRKDVPMTPKAGKVPDISKAEFDEGLHAALEATKDFAQNNLERNDKS